MAKKDEIRLLKTFIKNARKSTDSTTIELGKVATKILKQKDIDFSALKPIKTKDGFEAYLNIDTAKLAHDVISQKILNGIPYKQAIKQKDHPYLRGSPQLVLKMPLETTEEQKRQFLQKTTNYYKDLIKDRKVTFKNGKVKIEEITHRPKKGKKFKLTEDYRNRDSWIKKRVNELRKGYNFTKLNEVFYRVGDEIIEKTFGNLSREKALSPSTIRNIYYSR